MTQALAVRLCNWIGDVVLGLPALRLLEDHGHALHLYGKGWAPTLLTGYSWPVMTRGKVLKDRVAQLATLKRALTEAEPSIDSRVNALAMPNSFSSALELRLAGFKVSGYARDGRSLLLRQRQKPGAAPHALQSFWQLACGMLSLELPPPLSIEMRLAPAAVERARALVRERGWRDGYVCVAPFAAGTVHKLPKKWPAFPDFVKALAREGLPIVICPGPGEVDEARALYAGAQIVEDLPLDAYAALLKGARLVIANDTGPGHLAAGVGAPLVSVLGPTKVEQWAPWGPTVTVLSERPDFPALDRVLEVARSRLRSA
jgi:heptosyltransferase-2